MLNVAIALAFLSSAAFAPGQSVVTWLLGAPALQTLPITQQVLVILIAGYWLPALLIYLLLVAVPAAAKFRPSGGEAMIIGVANAVQVAYVCVKAYSFAVPGGGIGLVVSMAAPFTAWPALAVNAIVLSIIAIRRFRGLPSPDAYRETLKKETARWAPKRSWATMTMGVLPVLYAAAILFIGETAPFQVARTSNAREDQLCDSAGETIHRVLRNIDGLYWDYVGGVYFQVPGVSLEPQYRGSYTGWGGGPDGQAYANGSRLQFVEAMRSRFVDNTYGRPKTHRAQDSRYVRYLRGREIEYIDQLKSTIGVFRDKITTDEDEKAGWEGYEVTVRVLNTGEVTAQNRFFFNRRTRRLCGLVEHNSFIETSFLRRAFDW